MGQMKKKDYLERLQPLQVQLCEMQRWVQATGQRVVVVFEGRDTAGKGARLQAGGADFGDRNLSEQFSEAGHLLIEQRQDGLGRRVAPGEAGAAADQHAVDVAIVEGELDPVIDALAREHQADELKLITEAA